ncbi:MAG: hypothetical protein AAFR75_04525 [Pseudomonadota bacterium]
MLACGALVLFGGQTASAFADDLALTSGEKTITAVTATGEKLRLGKVVFAPTENTTGMSIKVDLDAPEFGDEFLSMRPFRCIPDPKEMLCHLAYPHKMHRVVRTDDLTDLEYELLFLFKPNNGYGIDAWNGLYFDLKLNPDGSITGPINEVDFNILAVPPDVPFSRPISDTDLNEVSETAHRFSRIEIR